VINGIKIEARTRSLTLEDLGVPLGGLPITITRTYSSIERFTKGEFSYGWKMGIRDIDLKEDGNRNVEITLPDGRRVCFRYDLTTQNPVTLRAVWNAEPGVYDKLEMQGDNRVLYDAWSGKILGFFWDYLAFDTGYEDSVVPGYKLTLKDGTVFMVNKKVLERDEITDQPTKWGPPELVSATDPNNNRLTFDAAGIHYGCDSSGQNCIEEVTFTRDPAHNNRVTAITDPAGNQIQYTYSPDPAADLVKVRLQDGSSVQYVYQDHYLTQIIDPLGHSAIRNEYDASGRLVAHVDANGNRIEYTHKPDTRQEVVKDRLGNITVYEYDDKGNVVAETNALGNRTEYAYNPNGNKTMEVDALGNKTTWTYDGKGNMLSETDTLGNTTKYTYDSRGNLLTTTDAMGHVTVNEYDTKGNLTRSVDAMGNATTYAYNASGNLTATTDALNYTTSYGYDPDGKGRQTSMTDARGNTSYTTYDSAGNVKTSTDRRGFTFTNTYDARGRLLTSTDPLGNITTYEYNDAGLQTAVIDATGARMETVYDNQGRAVEQSYPDGTSTKTVYDIEGRVIASIDQAGAKTETRFDALGRAVKVIRADGSETATTYDALGRAIQTKDPRGDVTTREYDQLGRTNKVIDALGNVTSYEYDALGRQMAMVDANGNHWGSEYDAAGRKVATVYPDGKRSSVEFDKLGRKIAEIDQAGIRTEFLFDENGNLSSVNDAEGGQTRYSYDANGNLLTITDPNSHVTEFTYDALGRKTSRKLPLQQTEYWTYEDCCRASAHTDFNGNTISYEYDSMKREVLKKYPDNKTVSTYYNARGQRLRVIYDLGTRRFEYDVMGRLTRDNKEDGQFIAYKYDIGGNLVETSFTGGHVVSYSYDALNRLATVTDSHGTTNYTYNKVGNRKSMAYPNNTIATYEYDNLNRLTYLENKGPQSVFGSYRYTLGAAGNRLQIVENNGDTGNYQYDRLSRLTREERTGEHAYWIAYQYDPFGNRNKMNTDGQVTTYTYDANDRLLEESGSNGIIAYGYDNNGNTIAKSGGGENWIYQWDDDNKLIGAGLNGNLVTNYDYNFEGERIRKITHSEEIIYLVDKNNLTGYSQLLREIDGQYQEIVYYNFGDDLIKQNRSGVSSYYHYDGLGSTMALSNYQGILTDNYIYIAFGEPLFKEGITPNNYLFTGDQYDSLIDRYYFRARYYNARNGSFISEDPRSNESGYYNENYEIYDMKYMPDILDFNRYIYVSNNPINYIDPSGLYKFEHRTLIQDSKKISCNKEQIAKACERVDYKWESMPIRIFLPVDKKCYWHLSPTSWVTSELDSLLSPDSKDDVCTKPEIYGAQLHRLMDSYSHWRKWQTVDPNLGEECPKKLKHPPHQYGKNPDQFSPNDADEWGKIDKEMYDNLESYLSQYNTKCCIKKTAFRYLYFNSSDIVGIELIGIIYW